MKYARFFDNRCIFFMSLINDYLSIMDRKLTKHYIMLMLLLAKQISKN